MVDGSPFTVPAMSSTRCVCVISWPEGRVVAAERFHAMPLEKTTAKLNPHDYTDATVDNKAEAESLRQMMQWLNSKCANRNLHFVHDLVTISQAISQ